MKKDVLYNTLLEDYYIPSLTKGASTLVLVIISFIVLFTVLAVSLDILRGSQARNVKQLLAKNVPALVRITIVVTFLKNYFNVFYMQLYRLSAYTLPYKMTGISLASSRNLKNMLYLPILATVYRYHPNGEKAIRQMIANGGEPVELQKAGLLKTTGFIAKKLFGEALNMATYYNSLHFLNNMVMVIIILIIVVTFATMLLIAIFIERLNVAIMLAFGILLTIGFSDLSLLKQYSSVFIRLLIALMVKLCLIAVIINIVVGNHSGYGVIATSEKIISSFGVTPTVPVINALLGYTCILYVAKWIYKRMQDVVF